MAKTLNFNNIKKQYLTVTLADENQTTLLIGTPTKAIMGDLMLLKSNLEKINDAEMDRDVMSDIYGCCANIMSRNKAGIKIDKKLLERIFDVEDVLLFFTAYVDFVSELATSKN